MLTVDVILYLLAVVSSFACMVLLLRGYYRTGVRLLLWSGLCFVGLSVNSALLFLDLVVVPGVDLRVYRQAAALAGVMCLLYGFIFEVE